MPLQVQSASIVLRNIPSAQLSGFETVTLFTLTVLIHTYMGPIWESGRTRIFVQEAGEDLQRRRTTTYGIV